MFQDRSRKSQGGVKQVSRKFQASLECHKASKGVNGSECVIQGCFIVVSRVFRGCFKGVSRVFQGCFKGVLRVFQGSLSNVSSKLLGCFKEVSRVFLRSCKEF